MDRRIHIFGASAAGTTTLGQALATRIGVRFLDADRYYWQETDPPFTDKRTPADRLRLIEHDIAGLSDWVLSGSLCSWGDALMPRFTLAVFLRLDPEVRMARLLERERQRYGQRIRLGGDMYTGHREFVEWAASYDTAQAPIRSLHLHENWLQRLSCPVLRLDSSEPVPALCDAVVHVL